MRIIVFFDLPIGTATQQKDYRLFRKFLIKDGYIMMQESVYSRMVLDGSAAEAAIMRLKKNKPPHGLVQALKVTEKQFGGMVNITGTTNDSSIVDTEDRLIVL
ncbi:MAG: CRISPR-associated endonuclease Cas2 [Eggerthellaceae bacterium]|nr:CRISPR-associated endonuclease Cas2 [Eggerthellaceae bacterium]